MAGIHDDRFEQELRKRHLRQLRDVQIPYDQPPTPPWPGLPPGRGGPTPVEQLEQWSKQAQEQIARAIASSVVSPAVNWDNELFTLLESAAVYLRDTSKVVQAVEESRKGTKEGHERALQLLYDSQADIKKIAALWGLRFEVICDLLQYSPEGYPLLNGPYCGIFYSEDTEKPFLGLAFKGTNPANWQEVLKDLKFVLIEAAGNILWGSPIHRGFYQTMFVKFPHINDDPFDFIKDAIDDFLKSYTAGPGITIDLHTTGHSLGGAYATLCYAELMRLYNNDPTRIAEDSGEDPHAHLCKAFSKFKDRQFVLRDLYTFGCPRVGGVENSKDWARSYASALANHEGKSWRVANDGDPVTNVPPVLPWISTWNHVDEGYKLERGKQPVALETEVGTKPFGYNPVLIRRHFTDLYFENLYNASTTGPKITVDSIPGDPENYEDGEVTENDVGELNED